MYFFDGTNGVGIPGLESHVQPTNTIQVSGIDGMYFFEGTNGVGVPCPVSHVQATDTILSPDVILCG